MRDQEKILMDAFRRMHPEDKDLLVDFAKAQAAAHAAEKPKLRLIVCRPNPPQSAALGSSSR
jgi:hypothetical protein